MEEMLKIRDLTKRSSDGQKILDNVSFDIRSGEVLGIFGSERSGKTMLLDIIQGSVSHDAGQIKMNESISRKGVRFVEQNPVLYNSLTLEEYIYFTGNLYGARRKSLEPLIDEILQIFHLEAVKNKYLETFPPGARKKTAFIAAYLSNPILLLLDNPFTCLDSNELTACHKLLKSLINSGKSVVFTSDRIHEDLKMCDRFAILSDKRINCPAVSPLEFAKKNIGTIH